MNYNSYNLNYIYIFFHLSLLFYVFYQDFIYIMDIFFLHSDLLKNILLYELLLLLILYISKFRILFLYYLYIMLFQIHLIINYLLYSHFFHYDNFIYIILFEI